MGPIEKAIWDKLGALAATHLEVINESRNHKADRGAESHFRLVVVAAAFEGVSRLERHRQLFELLKAEQAQGIHALSLQLYTPTEWSRLSGAPLSPPCE